MRRWFPVFLALLVALIAALPVHATTPAGLQTAAQAGSTSQGASGLTFPPPPDAQGQVPCDKCLTAVVNSARFQDHLDVLRLLTPDVHLSGRGGTQNDSLLHLLKAPEGFAFLLVDVTVTINTPLDLGLPEMADTDAYTYAALPFGESGFGTLFGFALPRQLRLSSDGMFDHTARKGVRRGFVAYLIPADANPATLTFTGGGYQMGAMQVTLPLHLRP